jgi:hypothetical protein
MTFFLLMVRCYSDAATKLPIVANVRLFMLMEHACIRPLAVLIHRAMILINSQSRTYTMMGYEVIDRSRQ